jgi:hypothetical protein
MNTNTEEWGLLEEIFKDEEFDVSYFSIKFPDGSSYEYQG